MQRNRSSPGIGRRPRRVDVVILGAGPTGLAAASDLVDAGYGVLIVEIADAPGGLCRTYENRGFYFDLGGHRFITRNPRLFQRVCDLLGKDLKVRERQSVIHIGGREYRYPLKLSEVLQGERISGVARILTSYLASRTKQCLTAPAFSKRLAPETLESWVTTRFGRAIFERFFRDYTKKLWGIEAQEIASDWAGQRISQIALGDVILHALGRKKSTPRTFATKYCYPRHGIGEIFSALTDRVIRKGGLLWLRSRASRIHPGKPLAVEVSSPDGEWTVWCDHLISTIPLTDLVSLLDPPGDIRRLATQLGYRSLRFLNLLLEGPHLSPKTWIYLPERDYLATRIQFPANRSPENCPSGMTSVQLEIPCQYNDAVWHWKEERLLERCVEDLDKLAFQVDGRLLGSFSTRARHAYPVYRNGFKPARSRLLDWVHGIPFIETCGRQGQFNYIFFDRAMEHGFKAASRIRGEGIAEPLVQDDDRDENGDLLPEEARSIVDEPMALGGSGG